MKKQNVTKYTGRKDTETVGGYELTIRQAQICRMVHLAMTNQSIANRLHLSIKTVKFHLTNIYKSTGLKSRAQLMRHMCKYE